MPLEKCLKEFLYVELYSSKFAFKQANNIKLYMYIQSILYLALCE